MDAALALIFGDGVTEMVDRIDRTLVASRLLDVDYSHINREHAL